MAVLNEGIYSEIGNRIQIQRRMHHLTQEQLAEKLDVSVKHISSVERGVSSLSLEKMILLCSVLDCGMDYLILNKEAGSAGSADIPGSIAGLLTSSDKKERELLCEYLLMFRKIRNGS